ncbi:lipocalin family protein [Aquimarina megaterium]|uniref:lipocalin family protein n=1 Tax=Aquimarina megaterium TaxID=1443666 RepID=UPI0004727D62|nr:lipocalin family protein [Aquimarina megaterium]
MNSKINITILTTILFTFSLYSIGAQTLNKNALLKKWDLDTYKIGVKKYPPSKKERNDYILFKKDMTFVSISEGKKESGVWMLNTNGGYIMMTDDKRETVKAYIATLTPKELVLYFDIEEIRAVEVHYKSNL